MKYLEVINLDKYQHYSNRETIWIKVYFKILNDYRFCQLRDSERWLFIALILLAIETNNNIPYGSVRGGTTGALWIYQRVSYRSPKGSVRVDIGVKNMLKVGLLRLKNAITERKIREDKKEKTAFYKSTPAFKKFGKWYLIEKGGEILFTGNPAEIEYK